MQNFIFGKVLQRVDSDGKRYFINLGTGDKVLAKGTIKANKIELIPSRVSLKDLEYAEKLKKGKRRVKPLTKIWTMILYSCLMIQKK